MYLNARTDINEKNVVPKKKKSLKREIRERKDSKNMHFFFAFLKPVLLRTWRTSKTSNAWHIMYKGTASNTKNWQKVLS